MLVSDGGVRAGGGPPLYEAQVVVTRLVWSGCGSSIVVGTDRWRRNLRIVASGLEPALGEAWLLRGHWREHTRYGPQLHVKAGRCVRLPPPHPLVASWLTMFDGIGPQRAEALLAHFGTSEQGLEAAFGGGLPVEDLAAVIAPDRPYLAGRIAAEICARWRAVRGEYRTLYWLEGVGVTDAGVARRIVGLIGPEAREVLDQDPYVLAAMLPWEQVDSVGRKVLGAKGIPVERACCRWVGAVEGVLRDRLSQGHTAVPKEELAREVLSRLDTHMRPARGREAQRARVATLEAVAARHGVVVEGGDVWRIPGAALMEDEIEVRLRRLAYGGRGGAGEQPVGVRVLPRSPLASLLAREVDGWDRLADEQREAVLTVLERPIAALVGGAGVGKTTTCKAICDGWEALGGRLELCALSGKAALRLSEATGREARTIYRLLRGLERRRLGEGAGGGRAQAAPPPGAAAAALPCLDGRTLLVIDEASMVDLASLHALVDGIVPGCRLLLVGDPFQLPPVGFGNPFHGLAEDPAVGVELLTVRRQTEASGIPAVARAIRATREVPAAPYSLKAAGVMWCEVGDASEMRDAIDWLVAEAGGFGDADHRLIIVAATNEKGLVSALKVNLRYHAGRRFERDLPEIKGQLGYWFSPGDPVVHLANDYEREIYNGSLGRVVAIDLDKRTLTARFGTREIAYTRKQMLDLGLAYALTCHRLQGSQVERVIVPVTRAAPVNPSWIYTAITRAETQAVLVGRQQDLEAAMARPTAQETLVTKRLRIS